MIRKDVTALTFGHVLVAGGAVRSQPFRHLRGSGRGSDGVGVGDLVEVAGERQVEGQDRPVGGIHDRGEQAEHRGAL
jgi:hypothetical protein